MIFPSVMMIDALRLVGPDLVIVNRLGEANPDVKDAEAAAKAPNKSGGQNGPQRGKRKQERIVRPFGTPGKDQQQNSRRGAHKDKQQDPYAPKPEVHVAVGARRERRRGTGRSRKVRLGVL